MEIKTIKQLRNYFTLQVLPYLQARRTAGLCTATNANAWVEFVKTMHKFGRISDSRVKIILAQGFWMESK